MITTIYGLHVIPQIMQAIQAKDLARLEKDLTSLVEANYRLGGTQHGFLFQGQFHSLLPFPKQKKVDKRPLHDDLIPAAKAYLKEKQVLVQETNRLKQGLHTLLRFCNTPQQTRDALPDMASAIIPDLSAYKRIQPEAWPILEKPMLLHDYEKTRDLIQFYVTNQLIY
jgi:hypothetical protein